MTFPVPSDRCMRHKRTNQIRQLPIILDLIGVVFDLLRHVHLLMRQPLMLRFHNLPSTPLCDTVGVPP